METANRSRRWTRLVALAGAAVLSASVGASVAGGAAGAPVGAGTAGARPATVLLPTGERLTVRWFGDRPRVGRAAGDTTRLTVFTAGDRVYAVPAEAMPYLDRTLDRGLFDVAALGAAERTAGAASSATTGPVRVPLTVTGSAAVPGLHATGPSTGWLDPTGAAAFGAALRDRIRQDPAGARTGSPVPGLTRLALPGAPAATVRPNYPMETLSITLTPPTGQTVLAAAVMVTNTDDTRKFWSFTAIDGNLAKVSVPQGHYTLIGDVLTAAPDGSPGTNYLPITTDLAVTTANQSTNLDANQATAESTYTTPATTALDTVNLDIAATDGVNDTYELGIFYGTEDQVLVQPTPEPAYGTLEFDTTEHRTDATGADWDLTAEWSTGIPADLHRTIKRSQLATVTDRVFADGATGTVGYSRGPVYPDLRGVEIGDAPTSATTHTNHLYGPPDVRWVSSVGRNVDAAGTGDEGMFAVPVAYPPGRSYRADWLRESLAPGFESTVTFPRPYCVVWPVTPATSKARRPAGRGCGCSRTAPRWRTPPTPTPSPSRSPRTSTATGSSPPWTVRRSASPAPPTAPRCTRWTRRPPPAPRCRTAGTARHPAPAPARSCR
jgi:hypothetical protein